MSRESETDDLLDLKSVRARVHNLNDQVQKLVGENIELRTRMEGLRETLNSFMIRAATRDQLDALGTVMQNQLQAVKNDLAPIQRGIWWVVTLILGAVILAVLALVFTRPVPKM